MNRSISDAEGRATEANRSFDATLSYAKFYVKYHLSSLRSTKKEQGTVSFSLHQPLGPVSISRRSAAGGCTDVQDRCAKAASASRPTCVCIVHARLSSCGAVVRAGSTTGMLLARGIHQPKHHQHQEAAGDGRRPTECAEPTVGLVGLCGTRRSRPNLDPNFSAKIVRIGLSGPKIFLACGALRGGFA